MKLEKAKKLLKSDEILGSWTTLKVIFAFPSTYISIFTPTLITAILSILGINIFNLEGFKNGILFNIMNDGSNLLFGIVFMPFFVYITNKIAIYYEKKDNDSKVPDYIGFRGIPVILTMGITLVAAYFLFGI